MKQCECRPIWETELTAATETVLGGSFDDGIFSKEIQQVTLYSDRIEFSLLMETENPSSDSLAAAGARMPSRIRSGAVPVDANAKGTIMGRRKEKSGAVPSRGHSAK